MALRSIILTPDNGEKFVVEMSNATLTTIAGFQAKDADFTITIDRSELEDVMIGSAKLTDKVATGNAKLEGNPEVLQQLESTMTSFDNWFEVLPGTKREAAALPPTPELLQNDANYYEGQ